MCLKQSKKISVVKGKWRPKLMGEDIRGWLVSPRPCLRDDFVQNGITFFFLLLVSAMPVGFCCCF